MEWPPEEYKNKTLVVYGKTLLTGGHGTIVVKSHIAGALRITIHGSRHHPTSRLHLIVDSKDACMYIETSENAGERVDWSPFSADTLNNPTRHALNTNREETYWLSLDKSNGELRYGKFFANATTVLRKIQGIDAENGGTTL